jgi:hypothetical protein
MLKTRVAINKLALLICVAASASGQTAPAVHQTATGSSCSNIVALSGAKVDCSKLTAADRKELDRIQGLLKQILANENPSVLLDKMDQVLAASSKASGPATNNPGIIAAPVKIEPCGILQTGGTNNTASATCIPPIRSLTDAQKIGLTEFLAGIPSSVQTSIGSVYGSGDAAIYAEEFFPLLEGRHFDNESAPVIKTGFPAEYTDVFVATSSDSDAVSKYRDRLVDTMNGLGISARRANDPKMNPGVLEIIIGFRPEEVKRQ